jgi:hypothetical protein
VKSYYVPEEENRWFDWFLNSPVGFGLLTLLVCIAIVAIGVTT